MLDLHLAQRCGSTGTIVLVASHAIHVANVGDSSAVLCRGAEALELTTTHRPDVPDEAARIQAAGGVVRKVLRLSPCKIVMCPARLCMICSDGNVEAYAHGPRTPKRGRWLSKAEPRFATLTSIPASRREAIRKAGGIDEGAQAPCARHPRDAHFPPMP
jgi:hypothetical protein